jgi:protein KRI1
VESVRVTENEARKRQRESKKERQEQDKVRLQEEIKQLKNIKKTEIQLRIQKLQAISRNNKLEET